MTPIASCSAMARLCLGYGRPALGGLIGFTLNLAPMAPASGSPEGQAAAARKDVYQNRIFLDPLTCGAYPREARAFLGPATFPVQDRDLAAIAAPLDFLV